jgi:uncharacterized protein (DUF433 family)
MTEFFAQDPAVMGGRLCLAGTRVTVRAVEALIEEELDDEAITREFPVTAEQVQAVRSRMGEVHDARRGS